MKLLKNAKILGIDYTVSSGDVLLESNIIKSVVIKDTQNSQLDSVHALQSSAQITETIDCGGNLLLPGFVNMHTHSGMTFLRSRADDLPLEKWLTDEVFPNEAKLTEEDQYWFTKLAYLEYIRGGTTTVFDMYLHNTATSQAAKDMKLRTVICGSVNDFGGTAEDLHEDYLKYNTESDQNKFVSFMLGFHAGYTTSRGLLLDIATLSNELKAPVWTHCSETREEVQGCMDATSKTPFTHFEDLGLWENGGGAFHCTHLTDLDLQVIRRYALTPVTCPSSNLKLTSGVADLKAFEDRGIEFAIGTDGPASNNQLSMFREMYLASVLQKNEHSNPSLLPPETIIKAATAAGANALGINAGVILPGKLADLVLVDLNAPNTLLNDPLKNTVYSADTSNVLLTILNGDIRYKNGEYYLPNNESVDQIYSECKKRMQNIFK